MSVTFIALPITLVLAGCFVVCFVWSVRKGQYEDLATPAMRMLFEDDEDCVK